MDNEKPAEGLKSIMCVFCAHGTCACSRAPPSPSGINELSNCVFYVGGYADVSSCLWNLLSCVILLVRAFSQANCLFVGYVLLICLIHRGFIGTDFPCASIHLNVNNRMWAIHSVILTLAL